MEHLKEKLDQIIEKLSKDKKEMLQDRLNNLVSVYPFNEYEYIISSLMGFGKITLDDFNEYLVKSNELKHAVIETYKRQKS